MADHKNDTRIEKASHIVEFLQKWEEKADHLNDFASHTCSVLTRTFGHAGYRRFDLLRGIPVKAIDGSLRGRVKNLRWRVAFEKADRIGHASEAFGEGIDATAVVLDFAHGLLDSWHRLRSEIASQDTWDTKSAKIATQITSVCLGSATFKYRTSTLDSAHRFASGVHAARWAGGILGYDVSHPGRPMEFVDFMNARIDSWADSITEGDNIYRVINTSINIPLQRRMLPSSPFSRERYMHYSFRRRPFGL